MWNVMETGSGLLNSFERYLRFYEEKLCSLDRKKKEHWISCCKLKHFFWITSRRKKKVSSWFLLKKTQTYLEVYSWVRHSQVVESLLIRLLYWDSSQSIGREQGGRSCSASTFPEVTILFFIWSREWKMNFIPPTAAVPVAMGRQHWPNGFHKQLRLATPNP